ncbi:MAG: competence protein ComEA [Idiomarinaceae bacterium HL-53]|nr:MAG: competence protein ComEA [Idiomarinaceae bacterium HL-53]CUS48934.1 competence protein ComEA [Idiomarinaceae bacterium HL-53]
MILKLGMVLSVVITSTMFSSEVEAHTEFNAAQTHYEIGSHALQAKQDSDGAVVMERVNINNATAEELAKKLKGVGVARARAIVELRERLGQFSDVEQLLEVRGIGVRTLNANRDHIDL